MISDRYFIKYTRVVHTVKVYCRNFDLIGSATNTKYVNDLKINVNVEITGLKQRAYNNKNIQRAQNNFKTVHIKILQRFD